MSKKMKLDFYYWSYQCPLNNTMLNLLQEYKDKLDITCYDIERNSRKAEEMNMFYPTLLVVNQTNRYFSPLRRSFLETLCEGKMPKEMPYIPQLGKQEKSVILEKITEGNCMTACTCTGQRNLEDCRKKKEFFNRQKQSIWGYMNVDEEGQMLGGAEYLPSMVVPYGIPKNEKTAFLTCVYGSDSEYDYKSAPLQELEKYLFTQYERIQVISDEKSVFPNGNMDFFLKNGYKDAGIIAQEKGYCTLHLLYKNKVEIYP